MCVPCDARGVGNDDGDTINADGGDVVSATGAITVSDNGSVGVGDDTVTADATLLGGVAVRKR